MWNNILMKIGIIGNGRHSKRIQSILKKKKYIYFVYKPKKPKYFDHVEFEKLKSCDTIFIISPDNTHFDYLKKLHKNRYIFCEKPPVVNKDQFKKLKKIKSSKIYFNYNFRFRIIAEILKKRKFYNLGKLIYCNITSSHGLAKKREYRKSWRADRKRSRKGVFEIVSIHYVDLINYLFNIEKIDKPKLLNSSKIGSSFDTSLAEIKLKDGGIINIATTYNSAYALNLFFLFENGILEQRDENILIRGPSLNIGKNGLFKKPKLIKKITINPTKDLDDSLKKSVSFFLNHVRKKTPFDNKIWNSSLESNNLIL